LGHGFSWHLPKAVRDRALRFLPSWPPSDQGLCCHCGRPCIFNLGSEQVSHFAHAWTAIFPKGPML
jgi:hypothetical protein